MAQLFGFVQFELPGSTGVPDGRYLSRTGGERELQRVLVVESLAAPAPPGRRRRRQPAQVEPDELQAVPLTRATAILAYSPFDTEPEAIAWLDGVAASDELLEALLREGTWLLNSAIHAGATARADPHFAEVDAERALRLRIGIGSGEEVAAGRFTQAREVDLSGSRRSRRRRREEELQPQERLAAVLGARERVDLCETLLLRARADLDAGRMREAAMQLQQGLAALLLELPGALRDPGHEEDMVALESRKDEASAAAEAALRGELDPGAERSVRELTALCERVLRRRRVLRG
ncbi:MAG TPA: hypothetical protein VGF04_11270 [Solirubrobacterales bacterium]